MNPFEMVIGIILIVTIGSVLKARFGVRKDMFGNETMVGEDPRAKIENDRLREELRVLKERIQVLERVVTDDEGSSRRLDREIEQLRDKNPV
jgi:hypothetical protein